MTLTLDRMAIEEVGLNPSKLAAAIHDQLGNRLGAVPVETIAYALDIASRSGLRSSPMSKAR